MFIRAQDSCILIGGSMTLSLSLFGDSVQCNEMHVGTKVIRGELVMVNPMCQPGRATVPTCVVKVYPGCVLLEYFG